MLEVGRKQYPFAEEGCEYMLFNEEAIDCHNMSCTIVETVIVIANSIAHQLGEDVILIQFDTTKGVSESDKRVVVAILFEEEEVVVYKDGKRLFTVDLFSKTDEFVSAVHEIVNKMPTFKINSRKLLKELEGEYLNLGFHAAVVGKDGFVVMSGSGSFGNLCRVIPKAFVPGKTPGHVVDKPLALAKHVAAMEIALALI